MKQYILKKGDVLEIPLSGERVGYVRAIGKDEFGVMFEIYGKIFPKSIDETTFDEVSLPVETVVYVNPHSAKTSWKLRFRNKPGTEEMPESFYGSPDRWWFVRKGKSIKKIDGWFEDAATIEKINPRIVSYEQMIADGYVHKALWLAADIEKFLAFGESLRWKW